MVPLSTAECVRPHRHGADLIYGGSEGLSDFSPDNASNVSLRCLLGRLIGIQGLGHWYRLHVSEDTKFGTVLLKLSATDDDGGDNAKHWYRLHVSEDTKVGTVLLKLSATDDDGGDNAKVGYRLAGGEGDHIKVDEKTGELTLIRPLDREANSVLRHAVIAFDHGAPSQISAVNLTIEVDDVNDNAPFCIEPITTVSNYISMFFIAQLRESCLQVRIPEDYPDGALVGCVAATDPDVGPNARLRFSLDPEENGLAPPFKIDHRTGCVFIHSPHQPLDFQRRSSYNLTIDVADNGEVVLSTTCSYIVELEDVDENLHPPEFDDVALEASVYENMAIGTEVITVKAVDQDNPVGAVDYNIVEGNGIAYFAIDSTEWGSPEGTLVVCSKTYRVLNSWTSSSRTCGRL
ncbi:unnamed protein product [Strongylus vulgaris]|uniref:Cadherin domain-containing protein n=1 Tax=Strongylus vulgaris TaxID=40348 RepID=A0A3P7J283_STRVU|nr:unnamed protein product [Strongylus vulgaris]